MKQANGMADSTAWKARMIAENELIARHLRPIAGPGALGLRDDAALARLPAGHELVLTKDMLAAGVHFFPDDPPGSIARKALRVNLSDLAAKGAQPLGFLLGLGLPAGTGSAARDEGWIAAFAAALGEDAAAHGCPLLGGDTVRSPGGLTLSVTALGSVPQGAMVMRGGGRAGDILAVTGTIGDAALGLRIRLSPDADWVTALAATHRDHLLDRYLHPLPRNVLAPALRAHARAAMDISDGLLGDAVKLGLAPERPQDRCRPAIDLARLPLSCAARAALTLEPGLIETIATGGDDYEILMACDPAGVAALEAAGAALGAPVTRIGHLIGGEGPPDVSHAGEALGFGRLAFEHRFEN